MNKITINKINFDTILMQTDQELRQGMQQKTWKGIESMYFKMQPRMHSFHTRNCIVPMDIIFVTQGKITKIFHNCPPNSPVSFTGFADAVIEFPAFTAITNRITIGQTVKLWQ